jgi:hypothetical protein
MWSGKLNWSSSLVILEVLGLGIISVLLSIRYIFMYQSEEFTADVSNMTLPKDVSIDLGESEEGVKSAGAVKKKKKGKEGMKGDGEASPSVGEGSKDAWWPFRRPSSNVSAASSPITNEMKE